MKHVFKLTGMGWDPSEEGIWFDAAQFSREEAEAQFVPIKRMSGNGPYTAIEYKGEIYRFVRYLGVFEDDKIPGFREEKE